MIPLSTKLKEIAGGVQVRRARVRNAKRMQAKLLQVALSSHRLATWHLRAEGAEDFQKKAAASSLRGADRFTSWSVQPGRVKVVLRMHRSLLCASRGGVLWKDDRYDVIVPGWLRFGSRMWSRVHVSLILFRQ